MVYMNRVLSTLTLLAGMAPLAAAQDYVWIETQFNRVYLRNGNFIDGKVSSVTEREIHLDIKPGQMILRRDSVDRIELVKLRTLGEKPKLDPPLKKKPAPGKGGNAAAGAVLAKTRADAIPPPSIDEGSKERVEAILSRLRIANPDQKDDLVSELARLGSPAAPYLASMMGTVDEESCQRLTQALIKMKNPEAIPFLVDALGDDRAYVRIQALLVIGDTGTSDSGLRVRGLLKDPQDAVRASAIKALHRLGDAASLPEIIEFLESEDASVRIAAINATLDLARNNNKLEMAAKSLQMALDSSSGKATLDLISAIGRAGRPEHWPAVGRYLRDEDPKTRATAAAALVGLASPESQEMILTQLAQEDDTRTRIQLAAAVRVLKAMKAIEFLIDWLRSEDPDILKAAEMTLGELTHQHFGLDRARWSEWWEQARRR